MPPHSLDSALVHTESSNAEKLETLSEMEVLGLDKPLETQMLMTKDEAERVPRALYLLHPVRKNEAVLTSLLSRFNLTPDRYDASTAPNGIFDPKEALTSSDRIRLMMVLSVRLFGTPGDVLRTFFSSDNSLKGVSEVARQRIEETDGRRDRYPIDHIEQFPELQKAYVRIVANGGPELSEIFHPEANMPPLGDWIMRAGYPSAFMLLETLNVLADALSGTKSQAQIARKYGVEESAVSNLLRPGLKNRKVFSEKTLELVAKKIRRDTNG